MRTPTGDAALIKKMNTAIVLECVLKHEPISRAGISELTGLNKATVSSLVSDLLGADLVQEVGTGESSGGRKPVMLTFNEAAGYAIGIDLGVGYIRGMVTDLKGNIVKESLTGYKSRKTSSVLPLLYQVIEALMKHAGDSRYGVVGIGIGVPGIVDEQGTILFAPNLEWEHVELQRLVSERFDLPVTIDNEANAGAFGEYKHGIGRGVANQIYISAGVGIGTGIVIGGELYKGTSGFSGELGHLSIALDGRQCRCGNKGCWELYASEQALIELCEPCGFDSLEAVVAAAQDASSPDVQTRLRSYIHQTGEYMGIGIANIVNVFNPEAVIIGNRMSLLEPWIREAVESTLSRRTLPYHRKGMRLLFAELRERSTVFGAASYAIGSFFDKVKSGAL